MGTSPDQLRDEIEQTRADLTHNVDTLAEKVNPSSVAQRRVSDARDAVSGIKDKVMGGTHSAGEHASAAGSTISDKVSDKVASLGDSLSGRTSSMEDRVSGAPGAARTKAQGNPFAAGMIAFGAGLLVSSLLPASQREQQAAVALKDKVEPLTDQVKEGAKQQAQQLKESLVPTAQDAVSQVKSTAQEGIAATKEHATSAAGDVADHAKGAAADTKADVADHAASAKSEIASASQPDNLAPASTIDPVEPLYAPPAPSHTGYVQ